MFALPALRLFTRGPQDKAPVSRRSRKSAQGATRRVPVARAPRKPSAWLNRIIILVGVGVVLIAALQAYISLQSVPVQRVTVTGELEHTQTELIDQYR